MLDYSSQSTHFLQNTLTPSLSERVIKVPRQHFTVKSTFLEDRFAELNIFREQIEQSRAGLHHKPYTYNKKNALLYKIIFFSFAFLFGMLGITVLAVPSSLGCGFFTSCTAIKGVLASLCTIFSLSAFTMAFSISHEREVIHDCIRRAKVKLATIYTRKCRRMGIKNIFAFFTHHRRQALALRHAYHEASDKINDEKEAALHLANRIATAQTLDIQEKEALLNQAVEELNEKLMSLCHTFRHISP